MQWASTSLLADHRSPNATSSAPAATAARSPPTTREIITLPSRARRRGGRRFWGGRSSDEHRSIEHGDQGHPHGVARAGASAVDLAAALEWNP
ncbi:Hypothetical protein A7982_07912 [Minicystis rosea]|nr:Hypothetical protein A7982_07912 [Minicystis rosea]